MADSGKFGIPRFIREQFKALPFPETPLNGRTIIVTGANVGLGLEAARHMCRLNAENLIIAVRTTSKGETAKQDILKSLPECKTNISVYPLNLSEFSSVKSFADKVTTDYPKIDIALLNAGISTFNYRQTKDGWEETLQINVLATTYLATLLLPKIRESYDASSALLPHLTIVASDVHFWAAFPERKQIDILKYMNDKNTFNAQDRYLVSKLFDVYVTIHLAKWVDENMNGQIVVNCVNPGLCHSELSRDAPVFLKPIMFLMKSLLARTTEVGSRTYMWAATATGKEAMGKFSGSCEIQAPALFLVQSEEGQAAGLRVWKEIGAVLTGIDPSVKVYFS